MKKLLLLAGAVAISCSVPVLADEAVQTTQPVQQRPCPIERKDKEVLELRQQLREQRIQDKKEFEAILTDKQLKKLEKLKQEHRQEFAKRHKAGMHKRPPMPIPCECNCGCKKK